MIESMERRAAAATYGEQGKVEDIGNKTRQAADERLQVKEKERQREAGRNIDR